MGLSHHPAVLSALKSGLKRYGLGANGSRTTTGSTAAHLELEEQLADFIGLPAAVLTPDGSLANLAACEALGRHHEWALLDERSHGSLLMAARGAGMQVRAYSHGSAEAAQHALTSVRSSRGSRSQATAGDGSSCSDGHALMTDGLFGASGVLPPLAELVGVAEGGTLLIDDSHALGIVGEEGAGSWSSLVTAGKPARTLGLVVTASLGKALGAYGGVVAGSLEFVDEVRQRAVAYRGSTPIPPAIACAASAALDVIRRERPLERLRNNIASLRQTFTQLGLPLPSPESPVFCFRAPSQHSELRLQRVAQEAGVLLPVLDYPGGPSERYVRIAVSAAHDADDIERLSDVLALGLSVSD